MSELEELFLSEKPCRLIAALRKERKPYAKQLAEKFDTQYAHTHRILKKFREHGLVEKEKDGRKQVYTLTGEGEEIADAFIELFEQLDYEKPETGNRIQDRQP